MSPKHIFLTWLKPPADGALLPQTTVHCEVLTYAECKSSNGLRWPVHYVQQFPLVDILYKCLLIFHHNHSLSFHLQALPSLKLQGD